ncbi:MAG: dockerin type I domain-containing protein [Clostridiales bacterium]|nr:dockerin type I domain-containing protein [Clostridiales bacterium]
MKRNKLSRKLVCLLVVAMMVAAPCTAFASQLTIDWQMNTNQMAGQRIMGWQEMVTQLKQMDELCDEIEVHTVDEWFGPEFVSDAGFPLYFAKVGHGDTVIYMSAQMHGNEKLTTVGMMEFLWEYAKDAALREEFKDLTLYCIPFYNVDGGSESTNISPRGIAGQGGVRTARIYRPDGTVSVASCDLNRDWKTNQRGEGMGFQAKTTQGYYRLWCEIMPDYALDLHHQGSYVVGTNPITFSLGIALMPDGPQVRAVADPIGAGLIPSHRSEVPYAVTLPFIKNGQYNDLIKQVHKATYDKMWVDIKNLHVYTSSSPNSTSQATAHGARVGDVYVDSCIDLYPGVDMYGVAVANVMLAPNYNNWNPYRWSCPGFYTEHEYQFNANTNLTNRYKGIALQVYYYIKAFCRTFITEDYKSYDPDDYWKVQHMTSGSRNSLTTVYGTDRLLNYPPVDWSFMDPVKAGIKVDAVSGIEENVDFTVEIFQPTDVLAVELEFEIDGPIAGLGVEGINGFEPMTDIFWIYAGDNKWRGSVTMKYEAGGDSTGYTHKKLSDIAKFVFAPKDEGDASMVLTGLKVVALDGDTTKYVTSEITIPTAATTIEQLVWSKYDLNKDNTVDALDLGIMLLYVGFSADAVGWSDQVKVNDSRGRIVTASMCDVNGDGKIDMLDLLDLFIHYTK